MNPLSLIPLAGPVFGAIGSILGANSANKTNETNLQIARETNQANAELAKYNWQQQVGMWNAQNAYNTPSAQMARYREAGLNPNLVYGQGTNGNSNSIPTPATPTMQAAHVDRIPYESLFGSLGNDIMQAYNFNLQREKLEADKDLASSQAAAQRANASKVTAEIAKLGMQTSKGWQDYHQSAALFESSRRAAELGVRQLELSNQNAEENLKQWPLLRAKTNAEIASLQSGVVKNYAQARLFGQQILESSQRILNLAAERQLTMQQTENLKKLGFGYLLDNSFKKLSFNDRLARVSADLTDVLISNQYHDEFGYPTGGAAGAASYALVFLEKLFGVEPKNVIK
ncbi:DNA pilot protein [Dipodfec virus UOA04_Rod_1087]|nr:DNA pilot protein [Dipodfec virus UOA04_Rod_1087]